MKGATLYQVRLAPSATPNPPVLVTYQVISGGALRVRLRATAPDVFVRMYQGRGLMHERADFSETAAEAWDRFIAYHRTHAEECDRAAAANRRLVEVAENARRT